MRREGETGSKDMQTLMFRSCFCRCPLRVHFKLQSSCSVCELGKKNLEMITKLSSSTIPENAYTTYHSSRVWYWLSSYWGPHIKQCFKLSASLIDIIMIFYETWARYDLNLVGLLWNVAQIFMVPRGFGDPLTLPLVLPASQNVYELFMTKYLQKTMICPSVCAILCIT